MGWRISLTAAVAQLALAIGRSPLAAHPVAVIVETKRVTALHCHLAVHIPRPVPAA
jgi:hypothetical protein